MGRVIIAVYRTFVSECERPSIAELCSVASRVARETKSSYLSYAVRGHGKGEFLSPLEAFSVDLAAFCSCGCRKVRAL